jgi:hypothetical protein
MKLESIYTPYEEAKVEILRRREDPDLRRMVEEFLGGPPPGRPDEPGAFLCRTVQTPNREFFRFMELASSIGLAPHAQEYLDDRFCSMNADKLGAVRMTFHHGINRRNEAVFRRCVIVAGNSWDGAPYQDLRTKWGENLVQFHHGLLRTFFAGLTLINESAWYRARGASPREFYPAHYARFICHGILLETYLETPQESPFIHEVVLPAFERVLSLFGRRPLIVPLLPPESAADPSWTWYDQEVERIVLGKLASAGPKAACR